MDNKLKGISSKFVIIPERLIINNEISTKRIGIYSYLYIRKGLDEEVSFSTSDVIEWNKMKVSTTTRKYFIDAIREIIDENYLISNNKDIYNKKSIKGKFNMDKAASLYEKESFAILYVDEIYKILNYQNIVNTAIKITPPTVLLVFAYLRDKIYRRPNTLSLEEFTYDGEDGCKIYLPKAINNRRIRHPEAYGGYYKNMADDLGISRNTLRDCIDILVALDLIIVRVGSRVTNISNHNPYFTTLNIFANTYKREKEYLLDDTKAYAKREIDNKLKIIRKYYKIDKNEKEGDIIGE